MAKSVFEFIAEAIDEVLPAGSGLTGREVYMRGWERYQRDALERNLAQQRRELERESNG